MRRLIVILLCIVPAACTNELDQSTRPQNLVGTYSLVNYGGSALPATIRNDSIVVKVVSGTLALNADNTWVEIVNLKSTIRTTTTTSASSGAGSYSVIRQYAYVTFSDTLNKYTFSGVAAGNNVTLQTISGQQMVYRK